MAMSITPTKAFADFKQRIAPELRSLNEHIADSLRSSNSLIDKIIENYLTSKGKQVRPIIVMLTARYFAGPEASKRTKVIQGASAVEMLHNASLIHDDVVDQTDLRRGRPTVNSMWDNHIAVLIGDFFVSSALRQAVLTGDLRIVNAIGQLGQTLSVGEMDQIYNARYRRLTEEDYFQVIGRKTASLFIACVDTGAFAVGIEEGDTRLEAMRKFINALGLCFQIRDDIFDYFDDATIGKPTGNDLREGKVTLPLIYALSCTEQSECENMRKLLDKDALTEDEILALINYAKEAGGIEYAYDTMHRLRDEAVECLKGVDGDNTRDFIDLFDFIIERPA